MDDRMLLPNRAGDIERRINQLTRDRDEARKLAIYYRGLYLGYPAEDPEWDEPDWISVCSGTEVNQLVNRRMGE